MGDELTIIPTCCLLAPLGQEVELGKVEGWGGEVVFKGFFYFSLSCSDCVSNVFNSYLLIRACFAPMLFDERSLLILISTHEPFVKFLLLWSSCRTKYGSGFHRHLATSQCQAMTEGYKITSNIKKEGASTWETQRLKNYGEVAARTSLSAAKMPLGGPGFKQEKARKM